MQAVTLKDAKRNLSRLVEQVLADAEPRIVVTDKGTGIPLQKQHRIFEPFFSLQSSVGNGLGLTFCKNVVEASDGRLLLQSQPGHGASFTIVLPLRDERAPFIPPTSTH